MRVKNRKCIRRLSFKSLWASRKRNIIAICANSTHNFDVYIIIYHYAVCKLKL